MKQQRRILFVLFLASFSLTAIAQESAIASGKNITDTGGSASYSVGQIVYTANSAANGGNIQGVQQPYEISTLGVDDYPEVNLQLSAYPNPTSDNLILSITNLNTAMLSYSLYDVSGRVIKTKSITENTTNIEMNGLQAAIYFVKVSDRNKEIKTFKIIKK